MRTRASHPRPTQAPAEPIEGAPPARRGAARAWPADPLVVATARALRAGARPFWASRCCLHGWWRHVETDWLWFDELGQEQVFWTLLTAKWMSASLAALATTTLPAGQLLGRRAHRACRDAAGPGRSDQRAAAPDRRARIPAVSARRGVPGRAQRRAHASWQQIVLWLHRQRLRGRRIRSSTRTSGFFVFSLPLYQKVAHWLFLTLAVASVCSFVGTRGNRRDPHEAAARLRHARRTRAPARARRPCSCS